MQRNPCCNHILSFCLRQAAVDINACSCSTSMLTAVLWQSDFSWPLNLSTACFQLLKPSEINDRFTNVELSSNRFWLTFWQVLQNALSLCSSYISQGYVVSHR